MSNLETYVQSLQGKTISIIGMGVSNYPLIRLLLSHSIPVTIRDKKANPVKAFQDQGAIFLTGEDYLANLTEDIIFRTPGLSPLTPELRTAQKNGQHITSEMQEFFKLCPCPVIAVTGSDGKTTTTTLISKFLEASGRQVFLGGNIGNPLLCEVDQMSPNDIAVVELSSFQLMDLECNPTVAVLTNLSPNHLDYHKDMAEYVQAKTNIFTNQMPNQTIVLNLDNPDSMALSPITIGITKTFSRKSNKSSAYLLNDHIYLGETPYLALASIKLKGVHNIENYMAALLAVEGYCSPEQIQAVAEDFYGVEHRMQLLRTVAGVNYFNDSIATSPTRCIAGLHSFDQRIILIAGGYDKGIPFQELGTEIHNRVKYLILTGATAAAISASVEPAKATNETLPGSFQGTYLCENLEQALKKAQDLSLSGDDVVLSPACAAFDQFKNFVERGNKFTELVNQLQE